MTEKKMITCIECPMGCRLTVMGAEDHLKITGYRCVQGKQYGLQETTNPTRVLTSTVWVQNGTGPLISVRSAGPIPKYLVASCVTELAHVQVKAPIQMGGIILPNIAETGVDIVATRPMEIYHA